MKKSKVYFIVPLIAIGVFFVYYWNFSSDYDAKQAAIVMADKQRRMEKLKAESDLREKAIADAIETQKIRKKERQDREAKEQKQKDDKENAHLVAEKADQEAQKLSRQVDQLTKDVATAKEEIDKINADSKRSVDEEAFLKSYVEKAEQNQAHLGDVLQKIEAADAAAAKAAALAAAEAKK